MPFISITVQTPRPPEYVGLRYCDLASTEGRAVTRAVCRAYYEFSHGHAPTDEDLLPSLAQTPPGILWDEESFGSYLNLYSERLPEERVRRLAALIERHGAALSLTARLDVAPPASPERADPAAGEDCWECGTPIGPGEGIIDGPGFAHRSCVGA